MNNHRFLIYFILCALFCACTPSAPQHKIGVSQCFGDAWRQKMNYEMDRELLLHPEMSCYTRIANGDNALQCAQIDSFISEQVDLLIVSPNEAEEIKPAITRAYRAGIPVIVADRRVSGEEWTAFIGGDNYKVGALMAQWIKSQKSKVETQKSKVESPFTILEVQGKQESMPERLRHSGFMDGLEAAFPVPENRPRLYSVDGSKDAYTAVSQFLEEHARVDAVVAQNDRMAIEASRALADAGHHSVPIMGVDAIEEGLQAIADGVITCSATYSSRGDLLIATAAQILEGKPFVRDTMLETAMIDRTAAVALLIQHNERLHDLETLRIVQAQSEKHWSRLQTDKFVVIGTLAFSFALIGLVVWYILSKQRKLQTEIKQDILPRLDDVQEVIGVSRRDEAFIERVRQIVDEHLSDPDFGVEHLGSMLQLSRTQLFRRIKKITGMAPMDYIRERKLIRANELLRTTDMTVRQVALELGFNKPAYFSKCYKDYFGYLPSER